MGKRSIQYLRNYLNICVDISLTTYPPLFFKVNIKWPLMLLKYLIRTSQLQGANKGMPPPCFDKFTLFYTIFPAIIKIFSVTVLCHLTHKNSLLNYSVKNLLLEVFLKLRILQQIFFSMGDKGPPKEPTSDRVDLYWRSTSNRGFTVVVIKNWV